MPTELNNMYLASGGKLALAFGTSASKIYGSVDADTVMIAAGVTAVLDGSFNRGNDTIQFTGNAASYSIVKVNASTVKITDALGTSVTIPVGSTGTHIQFADADRVLSGSSAGIVLGDQSVTSTAASLAAGTAPAEAYTLSVNAPTVTEGDAGSKTLSYKLTLDKAPTSTITVNYETLDSGSATANDDFVPGAGAVTFAAGQTVAYVSVTVLGDTTVEAPETVKLRLSGSKLVAAVDAVGTIFDNDQANLPVTYTLTGSGAVNEGSAATFELKTTGLAAGTTVGYKVTGTGSAANKSATGTFTIDSDGNATVSVPVSENNTIGDSGSLTIELLNGKATPVVATVIDGTPTTYSAPAISTTNSGSGVQTINVAGTAAQSITLDTDQVTANNGFVINSATAAVSVTSGSSSDEITLTGNANNTIVTGAGNDTVNISGSGDNTVRVGSGNDTVVGGTGNDTIYVDAGNLSANDSIDGGAGNDTLVIAGDGNVINGTNVKNIENLVLDGTTVTVTDLTALANVKSVSGHADTSKVIVNVANGDVVDLTGISLTTLKSLTLNSTATSGSASVTIKADAADLTNTVEILKTAANGVTFTVNVNTDVAGLKAISTNDTGLNGTKTVTDTVQNLIDNKSSLGSATLVVKGTVGLAESVSLANAGISASKTVAMSVADLLNAAKYPDQKAALTASGTKIQVLGTATVAEAESLISNYGTQISAYQSNAEGNVGIQIADTPANVGASSSASTLQATQVDTLSLTAGAGVSVDAAARIVQYPFTGSYTVADTAANINTAINGATLPNSLSKAASVALTTGNREVASSAAALELKQLGSKLVGGYDLALTVSNPLTNDDLSAIAGATKAALTKSGGFSVAELNTILGQNTSATVNAVKDTATNLAAVTDKLNAVTGDIYVTSAASVAEAAEINKAIATLDAKEAGDLIRSQIDGVFRNSYSVSDNKANVLAGSASTVIKGADGVTVTDAMTFSEAQSLRSAANASDTDRLATAALVYEVTDSASTLAAALSATNNTAAVATLAGAKTNGVIASGTATVAEAAVLGATYSSAVQVDDYKIKDTVAKLFDLDGTLNDSIDAVSDAALSKASKISVDGAVSISQMNLLKAVKNAANSNIFDNVYAIKDEAANIASEVNETGGLARIKAATSIELKNAASVSELDELKTLNDSLAADGKAKVSFALTDTIDNINGSNALGSATAAVVAFAKTASAITATGNASTITVSALDTLATKAGSANYSVTLSDTWIALKGVAPSILTNSKVNTLEMTGSAVTTSADANSGATTLTVGSTAGLFVGAAVTGSGIPAGTYITAINTTNNIITLSSGISANIASGATIGFSLGAANAKETVDYIGATAAAKLSYNLSDSYANLAATANKTVVEAAVNLTATGSIKASEAATLVGLTGAKGTVTYSLTDTYANVVAQAASIADGASSINVTDSDLTVAKYAELLNRAGATATVSTTVANEALKDTAAAVSAASKEVLAHAANVTLTDSASLVLNVAQAKALAASSSAYKSIAVPTDAGSLQVKIVDTTANLLAAAKGDVDGKIGFVLGNGSYKVSNSDTVTLSVSDADVLRGATIMNNPINHASVTYNLADASGNLVVSGFAVTAIAGAGSVTVTATSNDATEAVEAKKIFDANKNVKFDVVKDEAGKIGAYTLAADGVTKIYTYAPALALADKIVISQASGVSQMADAKAAAGSVAIQYDLADNAESLAASSLLAGATKIYVDTSNAKATVAEAVVLWAYASKLVDDASILVEGTAAQLKANAAAVSAVAAGTGSITVTGGTLSADDFKTLKAAFGTELAAATTITDTAANVASYIAGNNTAPASYAFSTGSKDVTVAQAKTLLTANVDGNAASGLIVNGTAAELLTVDANNDVATYKASDVVELSVAKDLVTKFESKASFALSTTAERFARAYDSDVNTSGAQADTVALNALKQATTLSIDGVAVTMGSKLSTLASGNYGKIVGTVAEINALPASLKSAAGYVIVDTVANVTAAGNASLVAGSAGYVLKDSAANLLAASSSVLSTGQKALGIEVNGAAKLADVAAIYGKTDVETVVGAFAVKYSLSDTAAALADGNQAIVDSATTISVSDVATVTQATTIVDNVAAAKVVSLAVAGSGTALAGMGSQLAKVTSVTVDTDTTTSGLQGYATADEANTILTNATKATVSLNIQDTAALLATAVTNTTDGSAKLATLQAAGTVSVTGGVDGTPATAAQAKQLAKVTVTGGYAVSGTAANLTDADIVAADDLRKASVVKVTDAATVQQAQALVALGNLEKGTGDNASKYVLAITDSALNIAKFASAGLLDGNTGNVTVGSYTNVLTAAQAKTLFALDTASTKLEVTAGSVKVTDTSANLLDAANASTVAAVGTINISDAITVAKLGEVKTAGGTGNSEVYSYTLNDSAVNLIRGGSGVVAGATTIKVSGTVSVADLGTIKGWNSGANVFVADSVAKVADTATNLFSGNDLVANVANFAAVIDLTGSATIAQVGKLLADSNFDKQYAIGDTASAIVNALGQDSSLTLLQGADSVGLSGTNKATAAQATLINASLTNEAALALSDTAVQLSLAAHASTVANAASVQVNMDTGNDGLTAGITPAKITYVVDSLDDMVASGVGLDVINGKSGDVINLTAIADWDVVTTGTQGMLVAAASASSTDLTAGKYFVERGYYSNGDFIVSSSGTDSRLLIETGGANTNGADEAIIILGVTSLNPNPAAEDGVNTFTFG